MVTRLSIYFRARVVALVRERRKDREKERGHCQITVPFNIIPTISLSQTRDQQSPSELYAAGKQKEGNFLLFRSSSPRDFRFRSAPRTFGRLPIPLPGVVPQSNYRQPVVCPLLLFLTFTFSYFFFLSFYSSPPTVLFPLSNSGGPS